MIVITSQMGMIGLMIFISVVFLGSLFVNYTNAKPAPQKKGETLSSISEKYFTFVTPARYTFAIWAVIYILAIIVLGTWWYIALNMKLILFNQLSTLMILFLVLAILNPVWIILLIKEYIILAWIVMLSILTLLIVAYMNIPVFNNPYAPLLKIYFSIYMGWIAAGFILNTSILLLSKGFPSTTKNAAYATILVLFVVTIISVYILFAVDGFFFTLAILWTFLGIYFQKDPRVASFKVVKQFTLVYSVILGICLLAQIVLAVSR